ncbi:MAG: hypothetical protein V1815_02125, partial [Candidatus Woesearchaeota archaeon]
MYKNIIALFCILLFVSLPVAYAEVFNATYSYNNIETPETIIGEEIIVEAVDYFPKVLKSSLIEEQDVNVQILLQGVPTNPAITIPKIKNVNIISYNVTTGPLKQKGTIKTNATKKVNISVSTKPSTSTSKKEVKIGTPRYYAPKGVASYDNLGYLVVPIRRIPKEEDVPDEINIELLARIEFSVSEGLNVGEHQDVLQEQTEQEWMQSTDRHKFFGGYIRASQVRDKDATFVIYDDSLTKVDSITVNTGSSSGFIKTYRSSGLSDLGNLGRLFSGYQIKVNEIRGTTNVVKASIFTGDKYIRTVLKEGATLYSGSQWRVDKINILDDKISAELRNINGEKFILTKDGLINFLNNKIKGTTKVEASKEPSPTATIVSKQLDSLVYEYNEAKLKGDYGDLVEKLKDVVKSSSYSSSDRESAKALLLKIRDDYSEKIKSSSKSNQYIVRNIEGFGELELNVVSSNVIEGKNDEKTVTLTKTWTSNEYGDLKEEWIGSSYEMDTTIGQPYEVKKTISNQESIDTLNNMLKQDYSANYFEKINDIETFLGTYGYGGSKNIISSSYYQNAIDAYQKVKVLLLNAQDPDELKAKSQFEIAKIYKSMGDNTRALQAYDELITSYANTNFVKSNQFMINNEISSLKLDLDSKTLQLEDNGNLISVRIDEFTQNNLQDKTTNRPKAYFEAKNDKDLPVDVCKKDSPTIKEKNVCEVGDIIINQDSDWIWKVDTINGDNVIIKSYHKGGQPGDVKTIRVGSSINIQYDSTKRTLRLTLKTIDMKREVWISIVPNEEKALSESPFNVHIPIEKRAIGLPLFSGSLEEEINKTEDLIKDLDKIIINLEKLHNAWIKFCYATFAFVWAKNFLSGMFGSNAAARQKVMGSWRERYEQRNKDESKLSYEEYVFKYSKEVDKEVADSEKIIDQLKSKQYSVAEEFKNLNENDKRDLYYYKEMAKKNPDEYNVKKYLSEEVEGIKNKVDADISTSIKETTQWNNIPQETRNDILNLCGGNSAGEYNTKLTTGNPESQNVYFRQNNLDILDCYRKEKIKAGNNDFFTKNWEGSLSDIGVSKNDKYSAYITQLNAVANPQTSKDVSQIDIRYVKCKDNKCTYEGKEIKNKDGNSILSLKEGDYTIDGKKVTIGKTTEGVNYPHAKKVTLVDSGKNDGLVEMISIDAFRYAQVEYSSTGAITNVYVYQRYNANDKLGTGNRLGTLNDMKKEAKDDRVIDILGQKVSTGKQNNLELLKTVETNINTLNKEAKIKKYGTGTKLKEYGVEKAAPKIQGPNCVDYMSPGDCKLLFNACDPVVCPASRCNAGGKWQVDNVVKTGVIGSIALCLPNMKQGIVMPVCLTGILAGLQNIKSILTGYAECLKVAKTKGESVGICDRVRNLYICDILWKEGLAIFNVEGGLLGIISKGVFGGQGGQEYSGFKTSFDNSVGTLKYFTQDYAKNVFASYSGGSLEEIGSEICKSAIYAKVPGAGDFFSEITKPESPPQFLAFFDEQIYSDIRTGGESQYSVYYHIYAGENEEIQYSVYLRARDTNGKDILPTVFVRKNKVSVNNVRLAKGGFADENIDFIALSGYKEVCVQIRSTRYGVKTECGFGKVTSDFGINYLNDVYISNQLGKTIKTEAECVPETGRLTTLSNSQGLSYSDVSLTQAAIGTFSTGLTQTGIIRKCSGYDPDITTNTVEDKWRPVGTCGKDQYGRDLGICYLYVPGVSQLIKDAELRNESLQTIKNTEETLAKQGLIDLQLFSDDQVNNLMDEASKLLEQANYKGAITNYESIVKHTLNEQYAAKAQFEIGNTYKKWADSLTIKDIESKVKEYSD